MRCLCVCRSFLGFRYLCCFVLLELFHFQPMFPVLIKVLGFGHVCLWIVCIFVSLECSIVFQMNTPRHIFCSDACLCLFVLDCPSLCLLLLVWCGYMFGAKINLEHTFTIKPCIFFRGPASCDLLWPCFAPFHCDIWSLQSSKYVCVLDTSSEKDVYGMKWLEYK